MKRIIAIRREDLSKRGEKRVAIVPAMAQIITADAELLVQPYIHPETGEIKRAYEDKLYAQVGAKISENIASANVIFGLKEIEIKHILPKKTYFIFSHTHKGQTKNRKMLRKFVDQKNTLIDYELMVNVKRQRVITAFTYFAGYAGMIDSLWTLGKRLDLKGINNPFSIIPQSIEKENLGAIKSIIREAGQLISAKGTPKELPPIICCFLGTGKTSTGAQEIFDLLPHESIGIEHLQEILENGSRNKVYKLVLDVPDMYILKHDSPHSRRAFSYDQLFKLYLEEPEHFESNLGMIFPYCTMMMNCIIWSPKYPRLLTRTQTAEWYKEDQTLAVIGDITCDPEGAIHFSKETWIDNPVFIYNPETQTQHMGFEEEGIAVMAVTNLPCEFSADASVQFSENLKPFISGIIHADFDAPSPSEAGLPPEIAGATILWKGEFTAPFAYMQEYL